MPHMIPDLIATWAKQTPEATAILAPHREPLSYHGLYWQIQDSIKQLRAMGLGRNDRIAMVLPNGPEMAVAFLAISSAATSAPLNPALSIDEFNFYLSDLRPKALIVDAETDSPARVVALRRGIPVIELVPTLGAESGIFALEGDERRDTALAGTSVSDDIALVLYTSGTTSRPKLVPLTHTNLWTSAMQMKDAYELDPGDRCLNIMPLFHIHGLAVALLAPLAAGGSIVCTPSFDASRFFGWMDTFGPTWYSAVPTMHLAILGQAEANQSVITRHPLRFICSRSAALPVRVMVELEHTFGAATVEAYGLTEASSNVTSNRLPPQQRKPASVGKASGPEVAIMDESEALVTAGQSGEIVIRGCNVFQGYEGNPQANRESFVDGWFRTGDQGYLDKDGFLFITGRLKEIINRGGEKIAPREIDDALLEQPAVEQAVTFAIPHRTLGEDVAAAVVLRKSGSATEQQIREWAFARLAAYKVPSQVLILDKLPTAATGKVRRTRLAEELAPSLRPTFVAPRTWVEDALMGIWAEVLSLDQIGVYDNFFALGGDSLSATRLVSRTRVIFHVEMPLESVFREPVLAGQALLVEDLILGKIESLPDEWNQAAGTLS